MPVGAASLAFRGVLEARPLIHQEDTEGLRGSLPHPCSSMEIVHQLLYWKTHVLALT